MDNPFLNRMSVNRERTSMVLCYDDQTCEWCELDDAGNVQGVLCFSDHWTERGQTVQYVQFIGTDQVVAIILEKTERWIYVFQKEREHISMIQTLSLKLPFPVMQFARQDEQLLLLFAVRHRSGTVQIGLYDPVKQKAEWVTPELDNPQFVFWAKPEREIGVNVGGVGRVYFYGKDTESSREIPYQEYAYPVMDKQGDQIAVCIPAGDGFCPGWMSVQEHVVQGSLEHSEPFSEMIRIQLDVDRQHILCEGIRRGKWQYVQYTLDGTKTFELCDYPGTLTQAVHSKDKQSLIGKFESITTAPVPARYKISESFGDITPLSVRHGDALVSNLVQQPETKYKHLRYGNEFIPYMDIHPGGEGQAVIYLHGGPHNCLLDSYSPVIARLCEAGLRVIGLNYPGSSGFGSKYKHRIQNDWGGVDADVIRIIREQVLGSYSAVSLYGVSYGAYLALLAAGRTPELWSAVVACAPFTDLSSLYAGGGAKLRSFLQMEIGGLLQDESALRERSPLTYASGLCEVDLQLVHGRNDQLCPVEQTERLYKEILKWKGHVEAADRQLELHIIDDLQHEVYAERIWAEKAVHFLTRNRVTQPG
ncbi:alpha/beta fold hydrolase [Paenibacillus polysaccharolyticus]|uniref:alpha/beta hydrolase family protein n=1 Tax=Paenibacillus polysaccharolyticus TaxID=582692 RepID=UPI00203AB776|nr:alpha/beta fold hydrolase [Paenibacillus polysaccharolyticus]MCM3135173.1 alpha/beta fold hydrolase [Paenibacillus polysaccharolyticus]